MEFIRIRNTFVFIKRLKIAKRVSKIGTASIKRGTNTEVKTVPLNPSKEITAIIKPKNKAPESPANILAG